MAKPKKQIKDTNIVKTPEVVVQPQFFIPPDMVDVRPARPDEVQFDPFTETSDIGVTPGDGGTIETVNTPDPTDTTSTTPTTDPGKNDATLKIISQKARQTADGTTVVDVVLEVDGGPGGIYEWRATVA